jgi:diguanylate cyclase (GGDEF)-like protein/PAS domain S-box-containing protein
MSPFEDSEVYRTILESLTTGLCVVDTQKKIVLWSDGAEQITGYARHEVIGHSCVSEPLLHCDQPGCEFCSEACPVAQAMKTSHAVWTTGFLHHRAGHEIPARIRAVPVRNQHGSIIGAVELFENEQQSSSRKESSRQLLSCVDAITGVANRAMMQSHLRQALVSFVELHVPFGLLLLRVEELSHMRAKLGSEAAACLLRVVAHTIEGTVSISDFSGRWEDDQFAVILSGCREEAVHIVRERLRRALAGEGIEWWGERHSLPVSIGEASAQPDDTLELIVERALRSLDESSAWRMRTRAAGGNSTTGS